MGIAQNSSILGEHHPLPLQGKGGHSCTRRSQGDIERAGVTDLCGIGEIIPGSGTTTKVASREKLVIDLYILSPGTL
jgi:hypothetical protein